MNTDVQNKIVIDCNDPRIETAVDELMLDPYNDGFTKREEIKLVLWEWINSHIEGILENLTEETHGPSSDHNYPSFTMLRNRRGW